MREDKITVEQEQLLRRCIEDMLGGTIVRMTRQVRWRPSWYVDVDTGNELVKLYVRGDRQSDVVPFPELKREADIISVLGAHGIPAPKIFGMCDYPKAIIMEAVPGTRDVTEARDDAERKNVAAQYIKAMVDMHSLPMEPFAEIGLEIPSDPRSIALAGLEAYLPLYRKHKISPQPLLEFAQKWLRANAPENRDTPSFVAFDAGQFLFQDGRITALYDFEFAMIGDPMVDIATMSMRHSHESMGEDIDVLCQLYSEYSGIPVDRDAVRYQHALFATVACMQFVGVIDDPKPGDPHDVYLEWTLALRRSLINALSACMGVDLVVPEKLSRAACADNSSLFTMLEDTVDRIEGSSEIAVAEQRSAARLVEYMREVNRFKEQLDTLSQNDAEQFVGKCLDCFELNRKMEEYVLQASAAENEVLLQYFSHQTERQVDAFGSTAIGLSAAHIRLEPLG